MNAVTKPLVCAVRFKGLKDRAALRKASTHANRQDASAQRRRRSDADPSQNLHHLPWAPARQGMIVDLVADYDTSCRARDLKTGHGAYPVGHLMLIVSAAWLAETGDVHDPANPRNRALLDGGIKFSEQLFGPGCVLAARLDCDERGAGIVDVFVAAEAYSVRGGRYLSTRPVLKKLQARYDRATEGSALQDAWAEFVQAELDPRIQRGKQKLGRGSDWVYPEVYGAKADVAKERAQLDADRAQFEEEKETLAAQWRELEAAREALALQTLAIADEKASLSLVQERLDRDTQACAISKAEIESERAGVVANAEKIAAERTAIDDQIRAMKVLLRVTDERQIIGVRDDGAVIYGATSVTELEFEEARRAAPEGFLRNLKKAHRFCENIVQSAHVAAAAEAKTLGRTASAQGFERGLQRGMQHVCRLFETVLTAYLNGELRVEVGAAPSLVAAAAGSATEHVARAAEAIGLAPVFEKLETAFASLDDRMEWARTVIDQLTPT